MIPVLVFYKTNAKTFYYDRPMFFIKSTSHLRSIGWRFLLYRSCQAIDNNPSTFTCNYTSTIQQSTLYRDDGAVDFIFLKNYINTTFIRRSFAETDTVQCTILHRLTSSLLVTEMYVWYKWTNKWYGWNVFIHIMHVSRRLYTTMLLKMHNVLSTDKSRYICRRR